MPSTLGVRNLSLCFSKIKQASAVADNSPPLSPTAISTPDEYNHHRPLPTTATSSPSIFIKNFNSLYDNTFDYSSSSSLSTVANEPEPEPADFATAFSSQRFFFSSPGRSNSIIESTNIDTSLSSLSLSSSTTEVPINGNNSNKFFNDSVAVTNILTRPIFGFQEVHARDGGGAC
ncbi:transcription repressor OFP12-like [Quillaja saponaria]|uniref:Transcription repressor OFP12-like n=1 Tax=Quillaja saponaria TaxID=32244 RepID=A0AAD7Q9E7_QUISA|nr:transcription repressor OFP12-like [Quillaja saponaria]